MILSTRPSMTFRSWFRTLGEVVFVDPRVLWLALVVPGVVLCVASAIGPSAQLPTRLTWAASVLQILGILQVAWGLHQLRIELGQPKVRTLAQRWAAKVVRLFGLGRPPTRIEAAVGHAVGVATLSAQGYAVDPSSLESRVAALEHQMKRLQTDLSEQMGRVNERIDHLSSTLTEQGRRHATDTAAIRSLMTQLFIGGLDLEVAGLVWILVGQVVATWPEWVSSCPVFQRLAG
jgi:hypothetical protein